MVVIRTPNRGDGRANGLQDSEALPGDSVSLTMRHDKFKQETANATNPNCDPGQDNKPIEEITEQRAAQPPQNPRSRWTDVNHQAAYQEQPAVQPQVQQQVPNQNQQWSNQKAQEHMWQEMQRRDMTRQAANTATMLQYNSGMETPNINPPAGYAGNGLPPNNKSFTPFNPKNSPMLTNAPNVDLQQNSMANGLLQNQQRHQVALDNTWTGQAPMVEEPVEAPPPQQFEVIPSTLGKPPQFIMRNPLKPPDVQGYPAQQTPQRYCPRYPGSPRGMMQPGMMMPQMMGQNQGMPQMGMTQMPQVMPQQMTMPVDYMAQAQQMQPASYPYGYGNTTQGNFSYQPTYPSNHGMHGQSANTTVCLNSFN